MVKMKYRDQVLFNLMLLGIFSFCWSNQLFGQEKVNVSVGMGLPEFLNVGVRYQLDQAQIAFSLGSMPVGGESIFSAGGDVYYHWGGKAESVQRRPWYGRIGLSYLRDETESLVDKYLYLNIRIGRDFNISRKLGIEIDAGAIYQLFKDETIKKTSSGWDFDFEFPILPSFGVGLFYRL
jgi:hypothetical protein